MCYRSLQFRDDKITLAKRQMETVIARRNDDVDSIVSREAVRLAYGPDSPYSRVPEFATVGKVTRDDMVHWHTQICAAAKHYLRNLRRLRSQGDGNPPARGFRLLAEGQAVHQANLTFNPAPPSIYFVSKDDVNQSSIQMVSLGIRHDIPTTMLWKS